MIVGAGHIRDLGKQEVETTANLCIALRNEQRIVSRINRGISLRFHRYMQHDFVACRVSYLGNLHRMWLAGEDSESDLFGE